jgi:uncharacterized protein YbbK (DUF523 family)
MNLCPTCQYGLTFPRRKASRLPGAAGACKQTTWIVYNATRVSGDVVDYADRKLTLLFVGPMCAYDAVKSFSLGTG